MYIYIYIFIYISISIGAELCELVGIYLLFLLANIIDKNNSGVYRDDGLILLRNVNRQNID